MKTYKLSVAGVFTAIGMVIMYASVIIKNLSMTLIALAGLIPALVSIVCGVYAGFIVYIVMSIIGILTIPIKSYVIMFITVFGLYPLLKIQLEKMDSKSISWILKIIIANIQICILMLLFFLLYSNNAVLNVILNFGSIGSVNLGLLDLFLISNAVFIVYEIGITAIFRFFVNKFMMNMKK